MLADASWSSSRNLPGPISRRRAEDALPTIPRRLPRSLKCRMQRLLQPVASNQVVRKEPDAVVAQPASVPPVPAAAPQASVRPAVLTVDEHRPMDDHRPASPANSATVMPALEGTVSITSDTEGAEIFVDSVGRGHAPTIIKLPAGRHSVQLVLAGHKDWVSEIELKGDAIVNVSAVFQPKQ